MSDYARTSSTYPHPLLTPIVIRPTNASIQALQKELFANAKAIHSTRGGGLNGHLALVMNAAAYLARTGIAFNAPDHPGDAPLHAVGATTAQITETNRAFKHDLAEHDKFITVAEELKQQVILAVPNRYFAILEDREFGYADVPVLTIIEHLRATYAIVAPEEIDANRDQLSTPWNPDEPIEDVWTKIVEIQRFALAANEIITDATALRLTLKVFEATGVFITESEKWRDKPHIEWTMDNFQEHFNQATKERHRKLTAQTAGYHGAHSAAIVVIPPGAANAITGIEKPPAEKQERLLLLLDSRPRQKPEAHERTLRMQSHQSPGYRHPR